MSNIIIQGNEINARKYLEKITIEGIGEEKSLNPRLILAKGGNSMINYSTEEQVIGTWIDGKPLYQKSFIFNYSDLNTNNTIKYTPGINSNMISNLKETISVDGILITNNYGAIPIGCKGYDVPYNTSNYIEVSKYYSCIGIISQNIGLQNEFNKLYVTVRYTKTTD